MILISKHFPSIALKDLLAAAALAALQNELPQITEDLIVRTQLLPQEDGSMVVQFTLHPNAEMAAEKIAAEGSRESESGSKSAAVNPAFNPAIGDLAAADGKASQSCPSRPRKVALEAARKAAVK